MDSRIAKLISAYEELETGEKVYRDNTLSLVFLLLGISLGFSAGYIVKEVTDNRVILQEACK
jgi:hypothetical protein